ncbi:MAG: membrane protein insertase YidC [Gammaproteobacteria bacterium]
MDIQRNILIVALLVVSYLLFLSWQQDYGAANHLPVQPGAVVAPGNGADMPGASPATLPADGGDLAGLTPAGTVTAPTEVPTIAPVETGNRVNVRTDVFDIEIDLRGGDIVSLKLPQYPAALETPQVPVQLMIDQGRTYLAQSGLVSAMGPDLPTGERSVYVAEATRYELADGNDVLEVVLQAPERDGVAVDKVYRFKRGDYLIDVRYRVRNNSTQPWNGFLFGQLKRDGYGDPSHPNSGFLSTTPTYLGGAYFSDEAVYNKANFEDVQKTPLKTEATGGWVAFLQHYFIGAWIPAQDQRNNLFTRYRADDATYLYGFTSPATMIAPGSSAEIGAGFFAGPKLQERLGELSPGLELTVDYGWFWFIAQPLAWLLVEIHALVGNWGVAIILLTLCIKILFFYPSHISYRSMANMRRITPELTRIRDEYKNDRQKQAQEMMSLYKREKVNPMGGCLPILVQMPVFIALYWVLMESVELRQAPFMLWIQDLSVMDPYFVLPILMGISMFLQTKLNPVPPDPMQAKMVQWLPWVFTLFFLFFASGLVLYWLVNNILSIAQQWYITKKIEREHAKA